MTDNDKHAFAAVASSLAVALQRPAMDQAELRLYWRVLGPLEIGAVQHAAEELARTWHDRKFPSTADWYRLAQSHQRRQREEEATAKRHQEQNRLTLPAGAGTPPERTESLGDLVDVYLKYRAGGMSRIEACAILEQAMRAMFPKGREEPWRYYCDRCADSGWVSSEQYAPKLGYSSRVASACDCRKGVAMRDARERAEVESDHRRQKRGGSWTPAGVSS